MGCCSARNCTNNARKGISLFKFPADSERRRQWEINSGAKFSPITVMKLCEVHFEENQFELKRQDGRKLLKWNAVPTLFDCPNVAKKLMSPKSPTFVSLPVNDVPCSGNETKEHVLGTPIISEPQQRQAVKKVYRIPVNKFPRRPLSKGLVVSQYQTPLKKTPSIFTNMFCPSSVTLSSSTTPIHLVDYTPSSSSYMSPEELSDAITKLMRRVEKMEEGHSQNFEMEPDHISWNLLRPSLEEELILPSDSEVYRLACDLKEARCNHTAGRDTKEIDTILTLLSYWPELSLKVRECTYNHLKLLHMAITNG